jgi:hypothetical protein
MHAAGHGGLPRRLARREHLPLLLNHALYLRPLEQRVYLQAASRRDPFLVSWQGWQGCRVGRVGRVGSCQPARLSVDSWQGWQFVS